MAKCTRKLIDAEAAKAAILELTSRADDLPLLDVTPEIGHLKAAVVKVTVTKILATLDALPDAIEGPGHAYMPPDGEVMSDEEASAIKAALLRPCSKVIGKELPEYHRLAAQPQEGE